jgi:dihydropyrimidinase
METLLVPATIKPAKVFGLWPKKGNLGIGADADIVIFDPNIEKIVKPEILESGQDFFF